MKKQQKNRAYKRCYDPQVMNFGQEYNESLTGIKPVVWPATSQAGTQLPCNSRVDFLFIIGEAILSPAHDKKKVE